MGNIKSTGNDIFHSGIMLNEVAFHNFPLVVSKSGLSFIILDCEHGGFSYPDIAGIIMSARHSGITIIVRLGDNGRKDITRLMDMGADGLLLPMTNTASDISEVVSHAKYAPLGKRGVSTTRAHTMYHLDDLRAYMREANERTMVFAQIETSQGIVNCADILAAPGVNGVFIGPNDLSVDLGCLASGDYTPLTDAINDAGKAAVSAGKCAGIITENKTYLQTAANCGFSLFCCGSEISLWKKGCVGIANEVLQLGDRGINVNKKE